jgi:hypothetical protein
MSNVFIGFASIAATGARLASGAVSANAAIPNNSAGNLPRYVRVTATVAAHVRLGTGTPVAVNTDVMVQPGDPLIMAVGNCANFAVMQESAAGVVIVTPLENS